MKNMKIGTRLVYTFGIVLILMLALCLMVSRQLGHMHENIEDIVKRRNVKQQLVAEIEHGAYRLAVLLYRSLEEPTAAGKLALVSESRIQSDTNSANYKRVEAMNDQAESKALFEKIVGVRTAYYNALVPVYTQLENNDSEAARATLTNVLPLQVATLNALDTFAAHEQEVLGQMAADSTAAYDSALLTLWSLAALALLVTIGLGFRVTRAIVLPLRRAVGIAQTVAKGDLRLHIEQGADNETGQLFNALKDMNENLQRIVGGVRVSSDIITTASGEIAASNLDLSMRTEEQAGSLEETASAMEQLTSTVRQNADNARQASQLALSASDIAARGGSVVDEVVGTMNSIHESSNKIVDIISVIDGIAFQTNILALNAAVEAARAGEQGRGFAVVASEVRNLAQRSAAAAKEIKLLIDDSVNKVEAGSKLVEQAGLTMSDVVDSVRQVTTIVMEISSASQEQSAGIEQINQAIGQMDETTQQNAALVEQAAAVAQSLQHQADNLATDVAAFKVNTDDAGKSASDMTSMARGGSLEQTALRNIRQALPHRMTSLRMPARLPLGGRRSVGVAAAAAQGDWEQF
jgi:methyl-accepting chemotaxis protein